MQSLVALFIVVLCSTAHAGGIMRGSSGAAPSVPTFFTAFEETGCAAEDGGAGLSGLTTTPTNNADCTALETPWACCTGSGTGICTAPNCDYTGTGVATGQAIRNIDSDNSSQCVGASDPLSCCTGAGTGTCRNQDFLQLSGLNISSAYEVEFSYYFTSTGGFNGVPIFTLDHATRDARIESGVGPYKLIAGCDANEVNTGTIVSGTRYKIQFEIDPSTTTGLLRVLDPSNCSEVTTASCNGTDGMGALSVISNIGRTFHSGIGSTQVVIDDLEIWNDTTSNPDCNYQGTD